MGRFFFLFFFPFFISLFNGDLYPSADCWCRSLFLSTYHLKEASLSILPHWLLFFSSSLFETYWLFLNFSLHKLLPLWLNALIYSPYNVSTLLLPVIYAICGLLLFNSTKYFGIKFYGSRYTPTWLMKSAAVLTPHHLANTHTHTEEFSGIVGNKVFKIFQYISLLHFYWNFWLFWKSSNTPQSIIRLFQTTTTPIRTRKTNFNVSTWKLVFQKIRKPVGPAL